MSLSSGHDGSISSEKDIDAESAAPGGWRPRLRRLGAAPSHGRFDDSWNEDMRGETHVGRADRNFADLLQETRVLQTGVQVLFALLVTVAFTGRLATADGFERATYVVTLVSVLFSAALLIAPVAYHRAFFRAGRKRELVESSHQLVLIGLGSLMVALTGATTLVLGVVVARPLALTLSGLLTAGLVTIWFVMPTRAVRRVRRHTR
jgi:hypothetical protein